MKYRTSLQNLNMENFCGPGGMSLGAKMVLVKKGGKEYNQIHMLGANDIDQDSCSTYATNICDGSNKTVDNACCRFFRK